jgi:hypothetical protein
MPSAWAQHLSAYRASHPNATLKQAMLQASACYRKQGDSHTPKRAASNLPKAASRKYRRSAQSAHNPSSSWISHVQAYRASHGCSFKDALQGASKTYRSIYESDPFKRSVEDVKTIHEKDKHKLWMIKTSDDEEYIKCKILEMGDTDWKIQVDGRRSVDIPKSTLVGIVSIEAVVDYFRDGVKPTNEFLAENNLSIQRYQKRQGYSVIRGYSVLYKDTLLENIDELDDLRRV